MIIVSFVASALHLVATKAANVHPLDHLAPLPLRLEGVPRGHAVPQDILQQAHHSYLLLSATATPDRRSVLFHQLSEQLAHSLQALPVAHTS